MVMTIYGNVRIHKRYVYMYVLYVYTYAHLSFKKGTDPTQARSRALVLAVSGTQTKRSR